MKWLLIINLNGEKSLHTKWPLTKRIMEKNEFCSLKFWVKALHFFFFFCGKGNFPLSTGAVAYFLSPVTSHECLV